jgi:hypothetical protein
VEARAGGRNLQISGGKSWRKRPTNKWRQELEEEDNNNMESPGENYFGQGDLEEYGGRHIPPWSLKKHHHDRAAITVSGHTFFNNNKCWTQYKLLNFFFFSQTH